MRPPHWALRLYAAYLDARMRRAIANPRAAQEALLGRIVAAYRDTEIGRALGLDRVRTAADFRRVVPVTEEPFYRPCFERVLATNARGIATQEPLQYIARTSGTTQESKLIPYPGRLIRSFKRFETKFAMHTMRELDNFTLLDANLLITSGNPSVEVTPSGLTVGYSTGIMTLLAPKMAKDLVRPTRDILGIGDWQAKIDATVRQALPLDIRVMTGVPIFVVPILERLLAHAAETGSAAPNAKALWPRLAAYYWSGSPITLYRDRLRELFGPGVAFREFYACAEGPVAYQYRDGEPGLLLDLENAYFEFQPIEAELGAPRLGVHEVEAGRPYRILLTTWGGIAAYRLGDVVEFVSLDPPLIRILGREREEISLGHERVQIHDIRRALAEAAEAQGAVVANFFVGPHSEGEKQAYHWYVEFAAAPEDPEAFIAELDNRLIALHQLYAGLRAGNAVLLPPRLTVLPAGAIERYILETRQFGQGKFLHLYSHREVPEAIMRFALASTGG